MPWKLACLPCKEGGLGIKNLEILNEAMLSKITWKILTIQKYPMGVLRNRFLFFSGITRETYFHSSIWFSIKCIYASLYSEICWFIGTSTTLNFWTDSWISPSVANQLVIFLKDQRVLVNSVSYFLVNETLQLGHITDSVVKNNIMEISPIANSKDICV